jgi:hypothetical protein
MKGGDDEEWVDWIFNEIAKMNILRHFLITQPIRFALPPPAGNVLFFFQGDG